MKPVTTKTNEEIIDIMGRLNERDENYRKRIQTIKEQINRIFEKELKVK